MEIKKFGGEKKDFWEIGQVVISQFNDGRNLRIGFNDVTEDAEERAIELKNAVIESKALIELILNRPVEWIDDNGIGRGGLCVDLGLGDIYAETE